MLQIKRVYEPPDAADGVRILVDRIWPRGVSKEHARLDRWEKDLGPSNGLRKWFGHDPARYDEFAVRYRDELKAHEQTLGELRMLAKHETVTLLYGARDEEHNQAVVLRDVLNGRASKR